MDLETIKKIIEKEGGKVIIIEDGKPTLVISRFEDNLKQKEDKNNNPFQQANANLKVESELETSSHSIQLPEKTPRQESLLAGDNPEQKSQENQQSKEEITLDDLPL